MIKPFLQTILRHCLTTNLGFRALSHISGADQTAEGKFAVALRNAATACDKGKFQKALEFVDQAMAIKGTVAETWNLRAYIQMQMNEWPSALESLDHAAELSPGNYRAWQGRGVVLYQLDRYEESIASFHKTLEIVSASGLINDEELPNYEYCTLLELWYNLGLSHMAIQECDTATSAFSRVLEMDEEYTPAWFQLGLARWRLGEFHEAIEILDVCLEQEPDHRAAIGHKALALARLGKHHEALKLLTYLTRSDRNDAAAWTDRGNILREMKRYDEAIESCAKAIKLEPDVRYHHLNFGIAQEEAGHWKEALNAYQRSLEICPDYKLAWNNIGMVNLKQFLVELRNNNLEQALVHWREAIRFGHKGQASDWQEEELTYLLRAVGLGHAQVVDQLTYDLPENQAMPTLRNLIDYLCHKQSGRFASLTITERKAVRKLLGTLQTQTQPA